MTLVIALFAAVASTLLWYCSSNVLRFDLLCWMFWGASVMWLVDLCFDYAAHGAAVFSPTPLQMMNDIYLGLSVIAVALVIWTLFLLVKDPKGVLRERLLRK